MSPKEEEKAYREAAEKISKACSRNKTKRSREHQEKLEWIAATLNDIADRKKPKEE